LGGLARGAANGGGRHYADGREKRENFWRKREKGSGSTKEKSCPSSLQKEKRERNHAWENGPFIYGGKEKHFTIRGGGGFCRFRGLQQNVGKKGNQHAAFKKKRENNLNLQTIEGKFSLKRKKNEGKKIEKKKKKDLNR